MKMTWAATQAKAKFSEVLDRAETEGPQLVRRRKREFIVMTREQHDAASLERATGRRLFVSAWEALAPSSGARFDVEFPRLRSKARSAKF
jgi:prevent-host-death family protein